MSATDVAKISGRSICSPENPMPKGAPGLWAHTNVKEIHDWGDGTVEKRCSDCGHEWTQELPE
jgi:hypothetical protein